MTLRRLVTAAAVFATFALVACDPGYDDAELADCDHACDSEPSAIVPLENPPTVRFDYLPPGPDGMLPAYNEQRVRERRQPPATTSPRMQQSGLDSLPNNRPDVQTENLWERPDGVLPAYNEQRLRPRRTPRVQAADEDFEGLPSGRDGLKPGSAECEECV